MIKLTEKAAKEVKAIMESMEGEKYLRISLKGGGCSGFSFSLNLDDTKNDEKDVVDEQHGIKIVIDKRSEIYTEKVTVDYHEDLNKRGFVFDVPLATGRCGCGSSFSF